VEEEEREMEEEAAQRRLGGAVKVASPVGSRRGSARLPTLCPHQLLLTECMTCALQSHSSTLHARHSVKLGHVHSLLSSLHSHSVHHSSHDRVSYGYFRYDVGASLLDATINHLTWMDEPVTILGLVVTRQLVMQAVAALITGGVSALSSVVPLGG
jgi:hypothetical protein